MTVYLGADHGGYRGKVALIQALQSEDYAVVDCGAITFDPDDDYPIYAAAVAKQVSADPTARGILLCRSGQGVAMVANKFPRVRAALAWNRQAALTARADDDANLLCLPADFLGADELQEVVATFLQTALKTDPRYGRRLRQITKIEEYIMHDYLSQGIAPTPKGRGPGRSVGKEETRR